MTVLLLFLVLPINCEKNFFENTVDFFKSLIGFGEKPFIPTGTHQNISILADTNVGLEKDPKEKNLLDKIQLNTTEWKCIDQILRSVTDNSENSINLLLTATSETVVSQIKNCYAEKSESGIDWFGWWQPQEWWNNFVKADWITQTDFWKFISDYYWYVIIAAVIIIVVIICLCKLCCVLCKKKNDEDLLE